MRRGRLLLFFALFVIILAVVAYFAYTQLFAKPTAQVTPVPVIPTPTPIAMVDVVMVTQHIDRGQVIDENVIQLVPYQQDYYVPGMLTKLEEAIGKRAKMDLDPPLVLTDSVLTVGEFDISKMGSEAALLVPRGMVALPIPMNRLSGVAYGLQRGDHVNVYVTLMFVELDMDWQSRLPNNTAGVLAPGGAILIGPSQGEAGGTNNNTGTFSTLTIQNAPAAGVFGRSFLDPMYDKAPFYIVPSEQQRPRLVSQTLIQDVIVLQVGTFPIEKEMPKMTATPAGYTAVPTTPPQPGQGQPGATPTSEPTPPPPDVITLIVSPQDAVTLNYLIFAGAKLSLALRPNGDDTRVQTEAVTLQFLLDAYRIPIPAKLPYGLEPRVDSVNYPALPNDVPTPTPVP